MMQRMVEGAGLNVDNNRRLSNHSARKFLIQKLSDCNVPANHIMQISGHKNISSINNYSNINDQQHQGICSILYSEPGSSQRAIMPGPSVVRSPPSNPGTVHGMPVTVPATTTATLGYMSNSNTATSSVYSGSFQHIFGGVVNAGNITINIHNAHDSDENKCPSRKRIRLQIDSDSD